MRNSVIKFSLQKREEGGGQGGRERDYSNLQISKGLSQREENELVFCYPWGQDQCNGLKLIGNRVIKNGWTLERRQGK